MLAAMNRERRETKRKKSEKRKKEKKRSVKSKVAAGGSLNVCVFTRLPS